MIYFNLYKSQIPILEQAIDTATLMLGRDKSRAYCSEMMCAAFVAGANLETGTPDVVLQSIVRHSDIVSLFDVHEIRSKLLESERRVERYGDATRAPTQCRSG
jgi:hypothetical protein